MTRALWLLLLIGCVDRASPLPLGASSGSCASCHEDQGHAFEASAHGRERSPVFDALLPRVEEAWGAVARDRCVGCHEPQHVPEEDGAIACVTCHAAVGNRGSHDGRLVVDLTAPLDGPFGDATEDLAHRSERRGFVSDRELCLTCHEVTGPGIFVEPTAMEHELARELVGAGDCASCHLPERAPGPIAVGSEPNRERREHSFVGPRPTGDADADEARMAALVAERVTLELTEHDGALEVALANVGMGHALPTGVAMLRSLAVVAHIDGARPRTETLLALGDVPMRGETPVALPTDADHVERRRLDPGEVRVLSLALEPGDAHVEVRLVYRAYRADLLEALELPASTAPELVLLASQWDRP